jgi:L-alanine-DL-glutamate epimerase-like enolase superfamily enzyme
MTISRRNLFKAAFLVPIGATFASFEASAEPVRKQIKITAIKALETTEGTIIKIETDAGIDGYGPTSGSGPFVRDVIRQFNSEEGSSSGLGLIGKDPLAIQVHHHNMFYAFPQRQRQIRVLSGIDIALWDLSGKILGQPVSKLLGGNYRDEIPLFSHCPHGGDFWTKEGWLKRAQELKENKWGFKAYKVDLNDAMGVIARQFAPGIGPQDVSKIGLCYELAREALGPDIDIIVHGHNELDTPSAIQVAEAVKDIKPLWFEDPLSPYFSESWMALRRSTTVPLLVGENLELIEDALPFIQNQAVDCLHPDLINSGGITGVKLIADMAAAYRMPVCLHTPGNFILNMASVQFTAAIHNAPMMECGGGAGQSKAFSDNAPVVRDGRMKVSDLPGLGLYLDHDFLKANRVEGEPWWG